MPYLNLDDGFAEHPRVDALSDGAFRELVREVCRWSATNWTTDPLVAELVATKRARHARRYTLPTWVQDSLGRARQKISPIVRQAVYERDGWKCLHCGSPAELTLDHIFPWSLGGTDVVENLQTLCRSCNSRKGARV